MLLITTGADKAELNLAKQVVVGLFDHKGELEWFVEVLVGSPYHKGELAWFEGEEDVCWQRPEVTTANYTVSHTVTLLHVKKTKVC